MSNRVCIYWIRSDLRLADNFTLTAALRDFASVIPVFIWAPDEYGRWAPGGASRWWLHHSLESLQKQYRGCGAELILRQGSSLETLRQIASECGASAVYWSRCYEPELINRDTRIKEQLRASGLTVESFNSALLYEPWELKNKSGECYKVFTPFWKTLSSYYRSREPLPAPTTVSLPRSPVPTEPLSAFNLLPVIPWTAGMEEAWSVGEQSAQKRLKEFSSAAVKRYDQTRNLPAEPGTSRLSPHLHFGEISPRQIWWELERAAGEAAMPYLREIAWREFAFHLLFYFSDTPEQPLRGEYSRFPWRQDPAALQAWQCGQTGYPIVDAGMRELWHTGWMHNRVRMIVASFLVKHLLIAWQRGAEWFWDTLVDADLANNTLGWQWTAGCGADAAPYFRIFNPVTQGEKFDPDGTYVRRWVPELINARPEWIHQPWIAPADSLRRAGVELGTTYPRPIVDHSMARARALQALDAVKKK